MKRVRRLYNNFKPDIYDLKLVLAKDEKTFAGQVTITGSKSGRPAKRISLHSKDLKITKAELLRLDHSNPGPIKLERIATHGAYDELRLHTAELLRSGQYLIKLEFKGKITKPMNGLYPCDAGDGSVDPVILATQFESHHAREVFPCIDEPEAKAVFELTLTGSASDVFLANTDPLKTNIKGTAKTVVFKPTPKMSTYLLAFAAGKLEYLEGYTKNGIRVRTYAVKSRVKSSGFALEVAIKTLEFYADYFQIDYPLNKCDLLALPDFASGAMENWGLITFREQALLVNETQTSLSMRQYVANVVAHELTHQWFGNLVTMKWWTDLWLNESFASLMSYLAVDQLFPEWQVWKQFIVDEQSQALKLDSLEHTHPISVDIRHPDEIRTIFDNISYEKGASVLLMLMKYIGEEDFRRGLQLYLKKHAYSNTESSDLWQAWEEVTGLALASFMRAWIDQPGYPIINVKLNTESNELTIDQQRFYLNPQSSTNQQHWPVPIFSNNTELPEILLKTHHSLKLRTAPNPLIINAGRNTLSRVIYSSELLDKLRPGIKSASIDELDRMGIIADSFEAAKAGQQSTIDAIKLLSAYSNEASLPVWEVIAANIGSVRSVMDDVTLRKAMNPFIQRLISKQYDRLGWREAKDDDHFDKLLRPIILGLATATEQTDALKYTKELFKNRDKQPLHPDIRSIVYSSIARHGGKTEFNLLKDLYSATDNSEEKNNLSAALTNFTQPELIRKSLDLIQTDLVRLQDVDYWISYSFANWRAKKITWDWLKTNWGWLESNMSGDLGFYMMPRIAARAFSDETFIDEFSSFFKAHMSPALKRPFSQAVETITWQSRWKSRDFKDIKAFFALTTKESGQDT